MRYKPDRFDWTFLGIATLTVATVVFAIWSSIRARQICAERGGHMRQIGTKTYTRYDADGRQHLESSAVYECQTPDGKWIPLD